VWCPIGGFRGWGGHGVPSGRSDPDLDERWHRVCDQESLTGANDILFFDRQLEFLPTSKAQYDSDRNRQLRDAKMAESGESGESDAEARDSGASIMKEGSQEGGLHFRNQVESDTRCRSVHESVEARYKPGSDRSSRSPSSGILCSRTSLTGCGLPPSL